MTKTESDHIRGFNNKSRILVNPGQWVFIMPIKAYIHAVPFVLDSNGDVVLKTAFPSRKFHKRFGGSQI